MGATDQLFVTNQKVLANEVPSTHGILRRLNGPDKAVETLFKLSSKPDWTSTGKHALVTMTVAAEVDQQET